MRAEIIARQRRIMAENGLDALVAVSPENFAWTTGFVVPSQPILRWRHAMVVVKADGSHAVVCVDMEETTVRNRLPGEEVRVWGEFTDSAMRCLATLLYELGLESGRIGIEMDYVPAGDFAVLQRVLPKAAFSPAEPLYARSRQIKTADEIALLRRLSRIADSSITNAFAAVQAGDTEMDIAAAMTRGIYAQGADQFRLMIVATGERSVFPNVGPTERRLQPQDVCRVEIFSMLNGCSSSPSSTCRRSRSSATASACTCTRIRISASTPTRRSRPAWCSASSRWSTAHRMASACRTRTWCW